MVEKGNAELTVLALHSLLCAQSPPVKQQNQTKPYCHQVFFASGITDRFITVSSIRYGIGRHQCTYE